MQAGEFQLAEEDVLKTRIIRKAKRTTQSENSGKGVSKFFKIKVDTFNP